MPKTEHGVNATTMLYGLDNAKAVKLAEINEKCEGALRMLTPTYPESERLTFDQQKEEARAYKADSSAECDMLAPLATARGISLDDLAGRVLGKASSFSHASGMIIGQRQKMEDRLDKATTVAEVLDINVEYTLGA